MGQTRPIRLGLVGRGGRHPVWSSITRKAGKTTSCTVMPRQRRSCLISPARSMWPGQRHWNMESIYEYGARAGFWRLHRLFTGLNIPLTVYGVATALARSPEQVAAMKHAGWEIASHGLKWVDTQGHARGGRARAGSQRRFRLHTEVVGSRPTGWYTGRCSVNTVRLTAEGGGSTGYRTPMTTTCPTGLRPAIAIQLGDLPYTLEANDMRFATAPGYIEGRTVLHLSQGRLRHALFRGRGRRRQNDVDRTALPLDRPAGQDRGSEAVSSTHARGHDRVWFPRRIDIARCTGPRRTPPVRRARPSQMDKAAFVAAYGSIYEHSAWIAEHPWALELGPAHDRAVGLHSALTRVFRSASKDRTTRRADGAPGPCGQTRSGQAADSGIDARTGGAPGWTR